MVLKIASKGVVLVSKVLDWGDIDSVQRRLVKQLQSIKEDPGRIDVDYGSRTAIARRIVYRIGRPALEPCRYDQLNAFFAANERKPRSDSNIFLLLFKLAGSALPTEGLSEASRRKVAGAMVVAKAWRINPTYLDHFVDQIGGWRRSWTGVAEGAQPAWVAGLQLKKNKKVTVGEAIEYRIDEVDLGGDDDLGI